MSLPQHWNGPPARPGTTYGSGSYGGGAHGGGGLPDSALDRGWAIVEASFRYLRRRPRLLGVAGLGVVATTCAALAVFVPVLLTLHDSSMKLAFFVASLISGFPLTFIATFFNVALLSMVLAEERGESPTIRDGLAVARGRLRAIVVWSLLASGVGAALDALARLPGGGAVVRIVGGLAGLAWDLATFFVIPVLVVDGVGAREAVRRSAATFRQCWGTAVSGNLGIGLVAMFVAVPGVVAGFVGADALDHHHTARGVVLLCAAVVTVAPVVALTNAVSELFTLGLYRLARDEPLTGPFDERQLRGAIRPKR